MEIIYAPCKNTLLYIRYLKWRHTYWLMNPHYTERLHFSTCSFYIRSLLLGVNDNPPLKRHGSVITTFYCRFKRFIAFIPYIDVHKNFHDRTEFLFGAFLLLLSIYKMIYGYMYYILKISWNGLKISSIQLKISLIDLKIVEDIFKWFEDIFNSFEDVFNSFEDIFKYLKIC